MLTLQSTFQIHMHAAQQVEHGVGTLTALHQETKAIHNENREMVSQLTNDARANWLTLGFLAGMFLAATFSYMYWWVDTLAFFAALFLIQVAFRR
jgi:hypothetical protein